MICQLNNEGAFTVVEVQFTQSQRQLFAFAFAEAEDDDGVEILRHDHPNDFVEVSSACLSQLGSSEISSAPVLLEFLFFLVFLPFAAAGDSST